MGAERRRIGLSCTVVLAAALLAASAAPAVVAPIAPVSTGNYEAVPKVADGGTYSTGLFSVEREDGRRKIVPTDGFDGIFYPDIGECDELSLPLLAKSVPISPLGRFRIRERTPVDGGTVQVRWQGRWGRAKRVAGSITIKFDGCTSTVDWSGHRVG